MFPRHVTAVLALAAGLSACTAAPAPTATVTATVTVTASALPTAPGPSATEAPSPSASPTGPAVPTGDALDVSAWAKDDFTSPSGRIWCALTAENALCHFPQGYRGTIPSGAEVCPDEGLDVTGVVVDVAGTRFFCSGDPTAYPVRGQSAVLWHQPTGYPFVTYEELVLAVLPYGKALRHGTYVCASAETGVTCGNRGTGHGFSMKLAGAVLF